MQVYLYGIESGIKKLRVDRHSIYICYYYANPFQAWIMQKQMFESFRSKIIFYQGISLKKKKSDQDDLWNNVDLLYNI